ncbi:hypothetical protein [Microbispora sp. NBC_01389]|uniref:hypothetical protein n=1 Tax=Microbispora sp. NBC_01389 TaxID=2903584 RepID=UPI003245D05E
MSMRRITFTEETVVVAAPTTTKRVATLVDAPGGLAHDPEYAEYLAWKQGNASRRDNDRRGAA